MKKDFRKILKVCPPRHNRKPIGVKFEVIVVKAILNVQKKWFPGQTKKCTNFDDFILKHINISTLFGLILCRLRFPQFISEIE